jgi:adenine-specific DNA-methyltransferase
MAKASEKSPAALEISIQAELPLPETGVDGKIPHLLKYMGSKREILDFVSSGIQQLELNNAWVCDLFAGTGVVSGSLKGKYNIHANDIQSYSAILSKTYLSNLKDSVPLERLAEVKKEALAMVCQFQTAYPKLQFDYTNINSLKDFTTVEKQQQKLIDSEFKIGFHLFAKYYSGTYWSYEQCVWIDSLRAVAEMYQGEPEYFVILSSLIFAMSYASQSTGHYAQFRDASKDNMLDILSYRNRNIWAYFERKFVELITNVNGAGGRPFKATTLNYLDCLRIIHEGTIVYADPPYQSVHYSRFYHALETLVKYDYPKVQYKGRYREDRHQSPFCKKTTVVDAFTGLFDAVRGKKSHLVLSYSDTGMISLSQIESIANKIFKKTDYSYQLLEKDHVHSNMGRSDEKEQDVKEFILLYKKL